MKLTTPLNTATEEPSKPPKVIERSANANAMVEIPATKATRIKKPQKPQVIERPKRAGGGYVVLANGEERRKINNQIAADVGEILHLHAKREGRHESWVLETILREHYDMPRTQS